MGEYLFLCSCQFQLASLLQMHGLLLAMLNSGHRQQSSTLIFVDTRHVFAVSQPSQSNVSLENLNKWHLFSDHMCVCLFWDSCCWGLALVWKFQRANPASPSWQSLTRPCYLLQQVPGIPQQLVVACSWDFSPYLAPYLKCPVTAWC